jgi:hypothetical protein
MTVSISAAELALGMKALSAFPWATAEAVVASRLSNVQDDLQLAEAVSGALNDAGVPFAGDVTLALKAAGFILPLAQQAGVTIEPGTPTWSGAGKGSNPNG